MNTKSGNSFAKNLSKNSICFLLCQIVNNRLTFYIENLKNTFDTSTSLKEALHLLIKTNMNNILREIEISNPVSRLEIEIYNLASRFDIKISNLAYLA